VRGRILLDERSAYFRAADQRGDLRPLASLLLHEAIHQRGERSEVVAYQKQLKFIEQHGGPAELADNLRMKLGLHIAREQDRDRVRNRVEAFVRDVAAVVQDVEALARKKEQPST
jgi:hypothetical protein